MRKTLAGLMIGAALLSTNCIAPLPPPPPPAVVMPPRPHAAAIWVPGHWLWRPWLHRYDWVPGHWKVRRGHIWVIIQ